MRIGTRIYVSKILKTDQLVGHLLSLPLKWCKSLRTTKRWNIVPDQSPKGVPEAVIYSSHDADLIYNQQIWVVVGSNWSRNLKSVATSEKEVCSASALVLYQLSWWLTFPARSRVLAGGCFGVMVEYNDIRTLVWGLKNNLSVVGSWRRVPVI